MSHIAEIELEIKSLSALSRAAKRIGMKFVKGQKTFKWYGHTPGQCEHALTIPNNDNAYEVGVKKKGSAHELLWDDFDPELRRVVGRNGGLLKQAYGAEQTKEAAANMGLAVWESVDNETGKITLTLQESGGATLW